MIEFDFKAIANATDLEVAPDGLAFPPASTRDLPVVLAARAAGAHGVDLEVLLAHLDVHVVLELGRHVHRGEGGVALLCDRLVQRIVERSDRLGEPLSLIGWSLGGVSAREAARLTRWVRSCGESPSSAGRTPSYSTTSAWPRTWTVL